MNPRGTAMLANTAVADFCEIFINRHRSFFYFYFKNSVDHLAFCEILGASEFVP